MAASLVGLALWWAGDGLAQEVTRPASPYGSGTAKPAFQLPPSPYARPAVPEPHPSSPAASGPLLLFEKPAPVAAPSGQTLTFTKEPYAPVPGLRRVGMQQPPPAAGMMRVPDEDTTGYQIQLEPPGPDRLFRLDSEEMLQERMRQEARQRTPMERIVFPDEPAISKDAYVARTLAPQQLLVEPNYVCYGRLHFEEKNAERYGWDLGIVSPVLSAGHFFVDVAALPYHCFTEPLRKCECSAGYCLPGDPVPYMLYPPGFSVTGGIAQAGAVLGVLAIFP